MYSIIYNPSNVPVRGYHPKGSLFRVDKRKFGVRVAISFPTELEAIAVIQHIETLATKEEVATFVKDLKDGGVRIVVEQAGVVEVIDDKVDILDDGDTSEGVVIVNEGITSQPAIPYSQLRKDLLEREAEVATLRSEIASLKFKITELTLEETPNEPYKTKFEFLEEVTGGVQKFTDLKNSFIQRLKFLFFPNKY